MESKQAYIYPISPQELRDQIIDGVNIKLGAFFDKHSHKKNNEEDLFTVEETMNLLKCSKQALYNWRKNGVLPSYRLGNRVYYKKSEIYSKLIKQE